MLGKQGSSNQQQQRKNALPILSAAKCWYGEWVYLKFMHHYTNIFTRFLKIHIPIIQSLHQRVTKCKTLLFV